MTDFKARLAAASEDPRTNESDQPDDPAPTHDTSPFSMDYDTSEFLVDEKDADRMVGLLIALSNLL